MLRHGSLFSGIGGFDLAAERVGWRNVYQVEADEFCRRVLAHHFPQTRQYGKIQDFDGFTPVVDVISGGFPCQPFSNAGKRRGDADDRHLWPEMLRVIRAARPKWVVGENVRAFADWSSGLVLESVFSDLESEGFEVGAFIVPAAGCGAPHRRERVFIVAHAERSGSRPDAGRGAAAAGEVRRETTRALPGSYERGGNAALADARSGRGTFGEFPSFSPICRGDDGLSEGLDGVTFSRWRTETLKAYGNAVLPDIAQRIFETIQAVEEGTTSWGPASPREASTQ